jgi:hypothetical protein
VIVQSEQTSLLTSYRKRTFYLRVARAVNDEASSNSSAAMGPVKPMCCVRNEWFV